MLRSRRAERFDRDLNRELSLDWLREAGGFSPEDVLELEALRVRSKARSEQIQQRLRELIPRLDAGKLDAAQRTEYASLQCGVHENRFSEIVRGWTEPRDGEREAITAALGKSVEELFESHDNDGVTRQIETPSPEAA